MQLEYSLVGLAAGILIGLTGMGGGAVVTPILLYFGVPPVAAVGTDLAFGAITKYVGAAQHVRGRTIDRRVVLRLAAGSVPGSLVAVLVLHLIRSHDAEAADFLVTRAIGVILMVVAVVTIAHMLRPVRTERIHPREPSARLLVPAGAVVGFMVGLTSIGSGTLLMAVLLPIWPGSGLALVGTDVAHGAILASTAAAGHALAGDIDFALLGNLLVGSIPGIMIGTQIARHLSNRVLKGVFAVFLFVIGARLV